jgi:hypothetical protein
MDNQPSNSNDGNLLIVGDSFCQDKHHWPGYLRSKISYLQDVMPRDAMRVNSIPGGGWWPVHQQIYANKDSDSAWFDQVKLLIIIHTFSIRVFSGDPRIHKTTAHALPLNWSRSDFDEPAIAHSLYYKYHYNEKFHTWAQIKGFDDLGQFLDNHPRILSIHLFNDKETMSLLLRSKLAAGTNRVFVSTTLMDIVRSQYPLDDDLAPMATDYKRGFYNHLSPYNNIVFADQLYKIINFEQDDFDLTQFNLDE